MNMQITYYITQKFSHCHQPVAFDHKVRNDMTFKISMIID
jgi:hypothetical protein